MGNWIVYVAALASLAGSRDAAAQNPLPPAPPALELIVLGSGRPASLGRAASSCLVLLDGQPQILVDTGPGSFARLGEAHASSAGGTQ